MEKCQVCGAQMRMDAELVEGQRQYNWYKCTSLECGEVFLVQERVLRTVPATPTSQTPSRAAI